MKLADDDLVVLYQECCVDKKKAAASHAFVEFQRRHGGLFTSLFRTYCAGLPRSKWEDLKAEGVLGMLEGMLSYDPEKGRAVTHVFNGVKTRFRSYSRRERLHHDRHQYIDAPLGAEGSEDDADA